jgi:PLD-like domain
MTSPAPIGEALARSLVLALGADCRRAATIARSMISRHATIVDLLNLAGQSPGSVQRVTDDFSRRGWVSRDNGGWFLGPNQIPIGLSSFLEGAAAMCASMPNDGHATTVVTMPLSPSAIGSALPGTGLAHAALVSHETFERVADGAVNSLTIMRPFLNHDGLIMALGLFERTRARRRNLIVRRSGGARGAVDRCWSEVLRLGVDVFDYTLPVAGGYETFHAKVLLADQDLAYVGSANMTAFARHSMELGILASVVRGIERIAIQIQAPSRANSF